MIGLGLCHAWEAAQRSAWYKDRLFHQLLVGSLDERAVAAAALARVGAQDRLLACLQVPQPEVRDAAQKALERAWSIAAGSRAYALNLKAIEAIDREDYVAALETLNQLVSGFPSYAEGWNRRASLYWQIGDYEKSIHDCKQTLALNPNHFGAWQGIGVCQLQLGNLAAACKSLRAALRLLPHDEPTRNCLRNCEELLRIYNTRGSDFMPEFML